MHAERVGLIFPGLWFARRASMIAYGLLYAVIGLLLPWPEAWMHWTLIVVGLAWTTFGVIQHLRRKPRGPSRGTQTTPEDDLTMPPTSGTF